MKNFALRVRQRPRTVDSLTVALVVALAGCVHGVGPEAAAGPLDAAIADTTTDRPIASVDGVDGAVAGNDLREASSPVRFLCPPSRALADRPDDSPLDQVRVLYALPSDGIDERLDTEGQICTSVASIDSWLAGQTGGARLRLDLAAGALDVGFVRLPDDEATLRGSGGDNLETGYSYLRDRIERRLGQLGLLAPNKLYAVFYGGASPFACGGGAWPPVLPGHVAALYLEGEVPGAPPCATNPLGASVAHPGYLDYALLHEILHTLGLVMNTAPNHHANGHVFDVAVAPAMAARDLMYAPRTAADPPWAARDPAGLVLDVGRDDYYAHRQPGLRDLAHSSFLEPLPPNAERPPSW